MTEPIGPVTRGIIVDLAAELNQLRSAVGALLEAENNCGVGFECTDAWQEAQHALAKAAGWKLVQGGHPAGWPQWVRTETSGDSER